MGNRFCLVLEEAGVLLMRVSRGSERLVNAAQGVPHAGVD